jgi:hypothetical protein
MSNNQYTICPGGCDKKVKFCCGKEINGALEKIGNAIAGEQRLNALDLCESAIKHFGEKPCLLSYKIEMLAQLNEPEKLVATIQTFAEKYPDNPVGIANEIMHQLRYTEIDQINSNYLVERLQRAIEQVQNYFPESLALAILQVGALLLDLGRTTAGRAHLELYGELCNYEDPNANDLINRLVSDRSIPLLLRERQLLIPIAQSNEWSDQFNQIITAAQAGNWLSAIEELTDLDKAFPDQPPIARAIAILESRLGNLDEMAAAWSQFADTPGVALKEAVHAEALSQLIDPTIDADAYDVKVASIEITDMEGLTSTLKTNKRFIVQNQQSENAGPKQVYFFFDRELLADDYEPQLDELPRHLAMLAVSPKRTDQSARVAIQFTQTDEASGPLEQVRDVIGKFLDFDGREERVFNKTAKRTYHLNPRWHLPENLSAAKRQELVKQYLRHSMLEEWPTRKLTELDGKTPLEVKGDEDHRILLLGAVLLLESLQSIGDVPFERDLFNELRDKLDLPRREIIEITADEQLAELNLTEISYLKCESLSDDALVTVFRLAAIHSLDSLTEICHEITRRPSIEERHEELSLNLSQVYIILAHRETDFDAAIELMHKARDWNIDHKQPIGRILVAELDLRISRGVADGVAALIEEIRSRHNLEPRVNSLLLDVMMRHGLVRPDGSPAYAPAPTAMDSAEPAGKIWTPDSEPAEAKKLWVPGD